MRITDLFEAPISHIEVHHMDEPGSFPEMDRKLLRNPEHLERIRKRFDGTDVDFNLYFVNQPGVSYVTPDNTFNGNWESDLARYAGITAPATIRQFCGVAVSPDPEAITVIYTSNANIENSIPMTPWIVAHRFAHALTDNSDRLPGRLKTLIAALPTDTTPLLPSLGVYPPTVMTMRSARTMTLGGDIREELIAQYLTTGKISFKTPSRYSAPDKAQMVAAQLSQKARQVEATIDKILDTCVGKMFLAV